MLIKAVIFLTIILPINHTIALSNLEQADIEEIIHSYAQAWNEQAGVGFAKDFSEDADFVNIYGMHFSGREEIESRHVHIMQTFLKDSKIKIENIKLREVNPGLVIALIDWSVEGFRMMHSNKVGKREGLFTQVFLFDNNKWEIIASQNTLKFKGKCKTN